MKKSIAFISLSLIVVFLLFGCSKLGSRESREETLQPAASEEISAAEAGLAQVTASPPLEKEASEYSSTEDIKKDFERFQEAIASQDKEKCEAIQGQDLRGRCQKSF